MYTLILWINMGLCWNWWITIILGASQGLTTFFDQIERRPHSSDSSNNHNCRKTTGCAPIWRVAVNTTLSSIHGGCNWSYKHTWCKRCTLPDCTFRIQSLCCDTGARTEKNNQSPQGMPSQRKFPKLHRSMTFSFYLLSNHCSTRALRTSKTIRPVILWPPP